MSKESESEALITVNGESIPTYVIEREISSLRERYSRNMLPEEFETKEPEIESDARENAIERVLLVQEAKRLFPKAPKSDVTSRFNKMKREAGGPQAFYQRYGLSPSDDERIRANLAVDVQYDMYLDSITGEVPSPSDEACETFYSKNEKAFVEPEAVRASHILLRGNTGMDAGSIYTRLLNLKQQLEGGADFNEIANKLSSQPGESGDLGFFTRGQMVPQFEQAAFNMEVGEISDVIQTDFGYHLIKVFERREERLRPFDEVKKEITELLWGEMKNEKIGEIVDGLKTSAEIILPETEASSPSTSDDDPPPADEEE